MISSPLPLFGNVKFYQELETGALCFDDQGLWRPLETILLPGSFVKAMIEPGNPICRVSTPNYPSASPLYTLVKLLSSDHQPQKPPSSLALFFEKIYSCLGLPYLWGGNLPEGTHALATLYPERPRDPKTDQIYTLRGVDCSGLIYYASQGLTARNSSDLIRQGKAVTDLSALAPGMLIGWKGHVLIVTERGIIESKAQEGVILSNTKETIEALLKEKKFLPQWPQEPPSHPCFVIRDLRPLFEVGN